MATTTHTWFAWLFLTRVAPQSRHIVDAQSFPAGSKLFPQLSQKGAYAPQAIFSTEDMQELVQYAQYRGVRIMIEFDVPGHGSWGAGIPQLMACPVVLDPTADYTYEFLAQFLGEMAAIFPEDIMFLGGDEVDTSCWDQNPTVAAWLKAHNMTSAELQPYFWEQMGQRVLPKLNKTISVWEADALQIAPTAVPKGTIANVYQSLSTADKTVAAGMPTVVSIAVRFDWRCGTLTNRVDSSCVNLSQGSHWYLDSECGGYNQNAWECIYKVEPLSSYTKVRALSF